LEFIKKKAKFDGEIIGEVRDVSTTIGKIKSTLFCDSPYAKVIFARDNDNVTLGFALFHKRYSSFTGSPSIWLDDLYVNPVSRSKGIGKELMLALKDIGKEINASHISWNANSKNIRGVKFYNNFGAELVSNIKSQLLYRYSING